MWIDANGVIYSGDCAQGDRAATESEIVVWEVSRNAMANNDQIKAQLADLDSKSIRTLHEAVLALAASGTALPVDTTKRLQDLETQKQVLRAQIIP
jgi:hypothetical protein